MFGTTQAIKFAQAQGGQQPMRQFTFLFLAFVGLAGCATTTHTQATAPLLRCPFLGLQQFDLSSQACVAPTPLPTYVQDYCREWIEAFDKSGAGAQDRAIGCGVDRYGIAFVIFRNTNHYVYIDAADDIVVNGWERIEDPASAAIFPGLGRSHSIRYAVKTYVDFPGEETGKYSVYVNELVFKLKGTVAREIVAINAE